MSLERALELMAGGDATPLAGGQSLVPLLNLRRLRPSLVVDLNRIEELDYIRVGETLRIGAMTRQATLERSLEVAARWPLADDAVRLVGHAATRSRGTVGGSVAFADPLAELPVRGQCARAGAVREPDRRRVPAAGEPCESGPACPPERGRLRRRRRLGGGGGGAAVDVAPAVRGSRCSGRGRHVTGAVRTARAAWDDVTIRARSSRGRCCRTSSATMPG